MVVRTNRANARSTRLISPFTTAHQSPLDSDISLALTLSQMIIPVNINIAGSSSRPLPPQFAQYGTDEVVLVELQGALEVESESGGQFVGKLTVDNDTVSSYTSPLKDPFPTRRRAEEAHSIDWPPSSRGKACEPEQASGGHAQAA